MWRIRRENSAGVCWPNSWTASGLPERAEGSWLLSSSWPGNRRCGWAVAVPEGDDGRGPVVGRLSRSPPGDGKVSTQPSANEKMWSDASPKRKLGVGGRAIPVSEEDDGRGPVVGSASRSSPTPGGGDEVSTQPSAKVKSWFDDTSPKRKVGVRGRAIPVLEEDDGRGAVIPVGRLSRRSPAPTGGDEVSTQPSANVKV